MRSTSVVALALTALVPACAFVPRAPTAALPTRSRPSAMKMQATLDDFYQTGVTAPLGFFDPLGFSKCEAPEQRRLREAELKHGRVAMLGWLGFLTQERFHPFFGLGDTNLGQSVDMFQKVQSVAPLFWVSLLLGIAFVEGKTIARGWQPPEEVPAGSRATMREGYITGDLGLDPFGLADGPAENFNEMRTRELNNGRLAMIAMLAVVVQELIDGRLIMEQTLPGSTAGL